MARRRDRRRGDDHGRDLLLLLAGVDLTQTRLRDPLPKGATLTNRMRRKLQSEPGKDVSRWRKAVVEPVFRQTKHARGFRQFLLRGLEKVQSEWALVCLGHNVLKVHVLCAS